MAQSIRDVMTPDPIVLPGSTPVVEAARRMRDEAIGDVLVEDGDHQLRGMVTDRDIVVRAVADGIDLSTATIGECCSGDLVTIGPDDSVDAAVQLMGERAIRRLPVVEEGRPVGVITIGDLAIEREPNSALADISEARPNN